MSSPRHLRSPPAGCASGPSRRAAPRAWRGAVGRKRLEPAVGLAWLGSAALAGVMVQGMLGGFRVRLNALFGTDLAVVHGCFAQVVFALLVGLAYLVHRPGLSAPARVA